MSVETLRPNAAGDATNWASVTGAATHHAALNDNSDSSYIRNTTGSAQEDDLNLDATALTTQVIKQINVRFRARSETTAGGSVQVGLRLSSTNSLAATQSAIPITATDYQRPGIPRPGGGSWAVSDLANLQVVAIGNDGSAAGLRLFEIYVDVIYDVVDLDVLGETFATVENGTSGVANLGTTESGDSIIVLAGQYNNTFAGTEITDSNSNVWTADRLHNTHPSASDDVYIGIFSASKITGGAAHSVTLTPGGSGQYAFFMVILVKGPISVDKVNSNEGTGTAATPGSTGTLLVSRELAVTLVTAENSTTFNVTASWTQIYEDETIAVTVPYHGDRLTTAATTALNPSTTLGTSRAWAKGIVTYYTTTTAEIDAALKKVTASINAEQQSSSATAEVDAALRKLTASLNAEQRDLVTVNSTLVKVAASIAAYMRPDVEIDSVLRKVAAALAVSHQQQITVGSTLRPMTASLNLQQEHRLTVASTLVKASAGINVVMVPAATITSTLTKLAANLNVSQNATLQVISTLAHLTASLNVYRRPEATIVATLVKPAAALSVEQQVANPAMTIGATLRHLTASLAASQRDLVTIDSDLVKLAASLNAEQRQTLSIDSDLRKVTASLSAEQRYLLTVASTLNGLDASVNLSQRDLLTIGTLLAHLTASVNVSTLDARVSATLPHVVAALFATLPVQAAALLRAFGLHEEALRDRGLHTTAGRAVSLHEATRRRKGLS